MGPAIEQISADFAEATGISLEHVTITWRWLAPGHYAVAGKAVARQPADSHPLLIELLTPDFHAPAAIEQMLTALADSLGRRTPVSSRNVFIQHRRTRAGRVFDAGRIVRW
ncbi:MAG TPA: hypothetical protein VLC08_15730 [Chitinolyticbacter sp.]|nr:hypothetical protein [Chitinolyticbacter sp.]